MAWSCWGGRSGFERTGPSGEPDTPEYIHVLTCTYEVSTRRGNTQQADDHIVFSLIHVEPQGSPHHLKARVDHVPMNRCAMVGKCVVKREGESSLSELSVGTGRYGIGTAGGCWLG